MAEEKKEEAVEAKSEEKDIMMVFLSSSRRGERAFRIPTEKAN